MTFLLKSLKQLMAVFLLVGLASSCDRGPHFPSELNFEGGRLEKATEWSLGGISGVVYVPTGETLEAASLQLGILLSPEHTSGVELHEWVMEQYHSSPTTQWYESSSSDEACKVGLTQGPRPFVALQVCRSAAGVSACAEADVRLDTDIVGRCLNRTSDCWEALCDQMWITRRDALEAEVYTVLESR